jgi:methylated-DNA-protein-cysteine methyltransferase related protein
MTTRGPHSGVEAPDEGASFRERVWAAVRRIPRGRVASYKLVGEVAGYPRSARFVGRAMHLSKATDLPWHRVVAADGRIVIRDPGLRLEQVTRLRLEGVEVRESGRLDYARYAWHP